MSMPDGPEMLKWFETIAYQEYANVYRLSQYLIHHAGMDVSLADDLVQHVFYTARTKLHDFYGHPKPRAWLYKTTRYAFSNMLRKQIYQRKMHALSLDDDQVCLEFPDPQASEALEAWMPAEDVEYIRTIVRKLSPKDQLLYHQLYVNQHEIVSLCTYYNISENSMKKRVYRLHKRMIELLNRN